MSWGAEGQQRGIPKAKETGKARKEKRKRVRGRKSVHESSSVVCCGHEIIDAARERVSEWLRESMWICVTETQRKPVGGREGRMYKREAKREGEREGRTREEKKERERERGV